MENIYTILQGTAMFLIGAFLLGSTVKYKHKNYQNVSLIKKMIGIAIIILNPLLLSGYLALLFFVLGILILAVEKNENLNLKRTEYSCLCDLEMEEENNYRSGIGIVYLAMLAITIFFPSIIILNAILIFIVGVALVLTNDEISYTIIGTILIAVSAVPYA